jgi:hypothetical protein
MLFGETELAMAMTISQIESAIKELPPEEFARLSEWFAEFEAQMWDRQIEVDLQGGKLESLINEAEEEFSNGECTPL